MNILDRVILTVYMLFMALISLLIIVLPFKLVPLYMVNNIIGELYSNWYYSIAGLLLFVVSGRLLISGVSSGRKRFRGVSRPAEFGDVKISAETFESLSLRVIKQIPGIKDVKVEVLVLNGELIIEAKLLVIPDINIPQVTAEVQSKIKSYIESITEINVKEVRVSVDNVAPTSAIRLD